jgi:hypothetical protein
LFRVQNDGNAGTGRDSQLPDQIIVFRFERCHQFAAKLFGRLLALVAQGEVAALFLREVRFRRDFALGFRQISFDYGIRAQLERMLPGACGIFRAVGGELNVSEHCISVRGIGIGARRTLGVGQGSRGIAGTHQSHCVITQDRGIFRLESECGLELTARLRKIAMLKFVFGREEIGGGGKFRLTLLLDSRQSIEVHLAVMNDFGRKILVPGEAILGNERGQILRRSLAAGRRCECGSDSACFNAVHRGFQNLVRVFADFVLDVCAVFANVVGPNLAAVLEVDDIGKCANIRPRCQQE